MDYQHFVVIGRETLTSALFALGPALIAALVIGLLIGVFQAATSINEATLTFVPKLFIVVGILALSAPFMIGTIGSLFQTIFNEIGRVGR